MIPVVVVESHHHALEHIHDALRKRRLLKSNWSMLHFDSHADLACPGQHIPAFSCYQPRTTISQNEISKYKDISQSSDTVSEGRNLYESLDSTSTGIAEWILPLVVAANLQHVHWIRPLGSIALIPTGNHIYNVGAWLPSNRVGKNPNISTFLDLPMEANVKVDLQCRYYLDDDSYVPTDELLLPQILHLTVSEKSQQSGSTDAVHCFPNDQFVLDVCLDYFSCLNPYMTDIERINKSFANSLRGILVHSNIYGVTLSSCIYSYQENAAIFQKAMKQFLMSLKSDNIFKNGNATKITALVPFYDNVELLKRLGEDVHSSFCETIGHDDNETLIHLAIEALPHLLMPHESLQDVDIYDGIQQRLLHLRQEISNHIPVEPFIITIARSCNDGFTPVHLVDTLQTSVFNEIHNRYCGCTGRKFAPSSRPSIVVAGCKLHFTYDYGSWEGSTIF